MYRDFRLPSERCTDDKSQTKQNQLQDISDGNNIEVAQFARNTRLIPLNNFTAEGAVQQTSSSIRRWAWVQADITCQ